MADAHTQFGRDYAAGTSAHLVTQRADVALAMQLNDKWKGGY